jgi:hypothetical protein
VTGCQPLYGGKPEKLHNPDTKKRPSDAPEAEAQIKYIEDCSASFTDDPKKAHPQPGISKTIQQQGDTALDQADHTKEDQSKVSLWKEAIDKYRNALIKDPFNVEATIRLAVTYDKVLRKGCALAMLKRLATLSNSKQFGPEANRQIDSIDANGQWFKGYRKEAMSAVGR